MPTRLVPTPRPTHAPSSLGYKQLPPFKAGGMATGGLAEPASSRGQLLAVTHTPPGNPHPALWP